MAKKKSKSRKLVLKTSGGRTRINASYIIQAERAIPKPRHMPASEEALISQVAEEMGVHPSQIRAAVSAPYLLLIRILKMYPGTEESHFPAMRIGKFGIFQPRLSRMTEYIDKVGDRLENKE